jgi:16S rRNA (uracil1498-N3)-methyltransferase
MSLNRFFVEPEALANRPEVILEGEIAHQLTRVLRLNPGGHILLLDGKGAEYEVELGSFRRQGKSEIVEGRVLEQRPAGGEPTVHITLYQALLKGEKFDYVLQKGTEVGVSAFVPIITERCVGQAARPERWRKIIREAAEQSRRGLLPGLQVPPLKLGQALEQIKAAQTLGLMAWEEETSNTLRSLPAETIRLALLVGPEGGFTVGEAEAARAAGVQTVSLGPRILRAETAGPIATALALYQLGDM